MINKGTFMTIEDRKNLIQRMQSWVIMIIVFTLAMYSRTTIIILFSLISFLAIKEYFSIITIRKTDILIVGIMYLFLMGQYFIVYIDWYNLFVIFIPVYIFVAMSILLTLTENTEDFLKTCGIIYLGAMMNIYSVSHLAYLTNLNLAISPTYVLISLVFLTQINDVYQYICGKNFGRRKITTISPNKTLEGFLGGVILTTITTILIGKFLLNIPLNIFILSLFGILISVLGFLGDIFMSAIKRDLKIKDTSQLIPGHGGILDRIDSLVFMSPVFFHVIRFFFQINV